MPASPTDFNEAITCHQKGELNQAEKLYRHLLLAGPDDPRVPANLAALLAATGRHGEAINVLTDALQRLPHSAVLLRHRARLYWASAQQEAAIRDLRAALSVCSNEVQDLMDLGWWLRTLSQAGLALPFIERAVAIAPESWMAWMRLAVILHECGRTPEALSAIEKSFRLAPEVPAIRLNASILFLQAHQLDRAWFWIEPLVVSGQPARNHLHQAGRCLQALGKLEDARKLFDRCIEMNPSLFDAHANAAVCSQELGELSDAERRFRVGLAVCADVARLHHNLGYLMLLQGRFRDALSEIRWRWQSDGLASPLPSELLELPDDDGCLLTLWSEQGVGDQLLMALLLSHPLLDHCRLRVQVDRRLIPLLKPVLPGIEWIPSDQQLVPQASGWLCSLLELPCFLFDNLDDLSRAHPLAWLQSPSSAIRHPLATDREGQPSSRIGISWSSANPVLGLDKSIPVSTLSQVLQRASRQHPELTFVDLQYGEVKSDQERLAADLGSAYSNSPEVDKTSDFVALRTLLQGCDYVLTISNVTAHLAGSLGLKTWLLLSPGVAGLWYWHHRDQHGHSLWYPSVRVLPKECRVDDWSPVLGTALNQICDD